MRAILKKRGTDLRDKSCGHMNENNDDTTYTVDNKKNTNHLFIITIIQEDSTNHNGNNKHKEYEQKLCIIRKTFLFKKSIIWWTQLSDLLYHFV